MCVFLWVIGDVLGVRAGRYERFVNIWPFAGGPPGYRPVNISSIRSNATSTADIHNAGQQQA
jgi:hypothetical protein